MNCTLKPFQLAHPHFYSVLHIVSKWTLRTELLFGIWSGVKIKGEVSIE